MRKNEKENERKKWGGKTKTTKETEETKTEEDGGEQGGKNENKRIRRKMWRKTKDRKFWIWEEWRRIS
jgi:hypothetical protein